MQGITTLNIVEPITKTFLDLIAKNKENEAYEFLYRQYHAVLVKFALGYLKAKEPAEEIVNDVLYKVWLKREKVAEISNLRLYFFSAVRNSCLTLIAKQKREHDLMSDFPFRDMSLDNPESLLISSELQKHIKAAIESLPPRCRQIYEMIRIEGLRNKDVSEKLNISVNTIDVQLAIALKRMVRTVSIFNQNKIFQNK